MPRRPRGVRPRRKDERAYELAIRRQLLDPTVARMTERLELASSAGEAWLLAEQAVIDLPDMRPAVGAQLGRMDRYHRARMTRTFSAALGVDIGPLLSNFRTNVFINQKIGENVALIRTIDPRFREGLKERIQQTFAEAPFDQQRLREVLQKEFRSSGYNLRRITRDQTSKTIGGLSEIRQTEIGIEKYRWVTAGDERVRPTHADNDQKVFAWASPPDATGHPGSDIQCFPGSVRIHPAGLQASVAYRYVGKLVEIFLTQGVDIAMTPNHPVLTESGWQGAGDLEVGEKLLVHRGGGRFPAQLLDPDLGDGDTIAQQLHNLLSTLPDAYRPDARRVDLHGNPAVRDKDVDVVLAPRELRDRLESLAGEVFGDLGLERSQMSDIALPAPSDAVPQFRLLAAIPSGGIGRMGEAATLIDAHGFHADLVGLAGVAYGEGEVFEAGLDHTATDSERGRDLFDRLARLPASRDLGMKAAPAFEVARVTGQRIVDHDGPVYNFETSSSLILANGIVTHNCRCYAEPFVSTAKAKQLGSEAEAEADWDLYEGPEPTRDEAARMADLIGTDAMNRMRAAAAPDTGDMRLLSFAQRRWGSQKMRVVDGDDFDRVAGKARWRGVDKLEYMEAHLEGRFVGEGVYGNGNYFGTGEIATRYIGAGRSREGWMFRAKLDPRAKIITDEDAAKLLQNSPDRDNLTAGAQFFRHDPGRSAALEGYDAVYIESLDYTVVLNQRALIVDGRSLPSGQWGQRFTASAPERPAIRAAQAEYDEAIAAHLSSEGTEELPRIVAAHDKLRAAQAAESDVSIKDFFRELLGELGDE